MKNEQEAIDDREALRRVSWMVEGPHEDIEYRLDRTGEIDAILAAGFHRTEVPEPSAEPVESHPEAIYSPEVFKAMHAVLAEASGSPTHALRLVLSREFMATVSVPQGEPSDAQVEAALDAWDSAGGPDAGRSGFRVMRAALRTARDVT